MKRSTMGGLKILGEVSLKKGSQEVGPKKVRIKICGIARVEDATLAADLGADFIGLNFYPPSPRYVELERAGKIREAVAGRCRVVGVFVNAAREFIAERVTELRLDLIQFHGDEDEAALEGWSVPTIRALRLRAPENGAPFPPTRADYLLLDRFHPELFGGTGRTLPLESLAGRDLSRVFVSGGLTPENVAAVVALNPYAVDVASGVESAPGVKHDGKLRSFFRHAKSA
jgi:phosphoribosylanthranilate isomerase